MWTFAFRFQTGSIKRMIMTLKTNGSQVFRFQTGSIKRQKDKFV